MAEEFPWDVGFERKMQPGEHLCLNDGAPAAHPRFCHEALVSLQLRGKIIIIIIIPKDKKKILLSHPISTSFPV